MRRIQVRRKLNPKQKEAGVPFGQLPIGEYFCITPRSFSVCALVFQKISISGAQLDSWDNDSGYPDQQLPQDFMVYPL
jgi:hypothetical protein